MAVKDKSKIRINKYMPYFYAGASLDFNLFILIVNLLKQMVCQILSFKECAQWL